MSKKQLPIITFKGKSLGIVILVVTQLIIGAIHVVFGLLLLAYENLSFLLTTAVYDVYAFIFGVLVLVSQFLFGRAEKLGGLVLLLFRYL